MCRYIAEITLRALAGLTERVVYDYLGEPVTDISAVTDVRYQKFMMYAQ